MLKVTVATIDTSGWIPDELTPWEDDITTTSTTTFNLIDPSFHFSGALKEVDTMVLMNVSIVCLSFIPAKIKFKNIVVR